MTFYGGCDPGNSGAWALVDDAGQYVTAQVMPTLAKQTDPKKVIKLLQDMTKGKTTIFVLEKPIAMPRQSSVSTLRQGINFGLCEMALAALEIPYELVEPKRWSKVMHQGIESRIENPKLKSALQVQRLMGLDTFTLGKATKPHEGLVDAFLIAKYCWKEHGRGKHVA